MKKPQLKSQRLEKALAEAKEENRRLREFLVLDWKRLLTSNWLSIRIRVKG